MDLADVVDDLYAGGLDDFVARRDAAVRAARAAKDRDLAGRIASLRKPTLAAWTVNLLVRSDPALAGTLRDLGDGLRDAERSLDGPALRALGTQRRRLVAGLVARARRLASDAGQPVSTAAAQEVERTLTAALADPRVADAVAAGTLTRGTEHVGFGLATPGEGDDADAGGADGGAGAVGDGGGRATPGRPGAGASRTGARTGARTGRSAGAGEADDDAEDDGSATSPRRTTGTRRGTHDDADARDRRERDRRAREAERRRQRHERAVAAREAADADLDRARTHHDDAAAAERDAATALEDAERASADAYAAEDALVRELAEVRRRLADARAALPRADEALVAARGRARDQEKAVRTARRELDRATSQAERARENERTAAAEAAAED